MEAIRDSGESAGAENNILWFSTGEEQELFGNPGPLVNRLRDSTAVLCYNDQIAIRLIEFLRARGKRVPEDISVIGIDNCEVSGICDPPLTTFSHPKRELGIRAAETLVRMISGEKEPSFLYGPRLVERGSVKPLGEDAR